MADEIRLRDEDIHPRILAACELIRAQRRRTDREAKLRAIAGRSKEERIEEAARCEDIESEKEMMEQGVTSEVKESELIDNKDSEEMRAERDADSVYSLYLSLVKEISDDVDALVKTVLEDGKISISTVIERTNVRLVRKLRFVNNKCLKGHSSCSSNVEQLNMFKSLMQDMLKSLILELQEDT